MSRASADFTDSDPGLAIAGDGPQGSDSQAERLRAMRAIADGVTMETASPGAARRSWSGWPSPSTGSTTRRGSTPTARSGPGADRAGPPPC